MLALPFRMLICSSFSVVPSEDAHQSEYVAASDKRREWISGSVLFFSRPVRELTVIYRFTGSAGQAVVSKTAAYLVTDSRYWLQARTELDSNWHLIPAGAVDGPRDWIDWLVVRVYRLSSTPFTFLRVLCQDRAKDANIGIDARMISHEKATSLNTQLKVKSSRLTYPPQNYIDLAWKDKPLRSKEPVFIQSLEFTGRDASTKIAEVRAWIRAQPASIPSYSKTTPTPAQMHVGTLITSLSSIGQSNFHRYLLRYLPRSLLAWLLNLRGSDIPFNPLFYAYLFISLDRVVLFLDAIKLTDEVEEHLRALNIERKEYNDIWAFLRRREWGDGKILISPETSYAISLMLTHFRYTVVPSFIDSIKAIKNGVELEGLRRAYLRDGAAYVRMFVWDFCSSPHTLV
jgi:Xaa-Pro aminopeptidase